MTPEEMDALSTEQLRALIVENKIRAAEIRGRLAAMREMTAADPRFVEALRQSAWAQSQPLSIGVKDGKLTGVPEGWPKGVEADDFINSELDKLFAAAPDAAPTPASQPVSENVRRLRTLIDGGKQS